MIQLQSIIFLHFSTNSEILKVLYKKDGIRESRWGRVTTGGYVST